MSFIKLYLENEFINDKFLKNNEYVHYLWLLVRVVGRRRQFGPIFRFQ